MPGSITITLSGLTHPGTLGLLGPDPRTMALSAARVLTAAAAGAFVGTSTLSVAYSTSDAVVATGTLTISSGSGAVGGTIDGTTVTATWATSDTNSAALVAAAINANTTTNKKVYATSAGGVVTVAALVPGIQGNAITLVASGTGVTASGAKLGAGTGTAGVGADTPTTATATALTAF